ncbi:MAG: sigma-70 family RNA polymerase sigma factor [Saprospiraceae bacterium]|nr:sigma-70 family RNA polymerase sigma factor [Saprospiraceae bacterium]
MSTDRLQHYWQTFVRKSDKYSLQWIFQEIVGDLYRYGLRYVGNEEDVKDAIQDVFVNIWTYRKTLPGQVNVKAYLLVSLRHQLIKMKGYIKFDLLTSDHERLLSTEEDEPVIDPGIKEAIISKVNDLPERQREILYLKYFEELSYSEIALVLNIKYQSVINQAHRAVTKLRSDRQLGRLVAFKLNLNLNHS